MKVTSISDTTAYTLAFDQLLDDAWKLLENAYDTVDKMGLTESQREILKVRLDIARHHITDAADRANDMM